MNPSRNFHKATRNADSSSLMLDSLSCRLVSSALLLRLPSPTASCGFLLPTGRLVSLGPAFPTPVPVSSEISSPGFCLVSRQNKQKDRLLGAPFSWCHNIGMGFSLEKCTMLVMNSWKRHMTEGMKLPYQEKN